MDSLVNTINDDVFCTSDTPLAAFLISSGIPLLHIDFNGSRAIFNFNRDDALSQLVAQFRSAGATGNIVAYEQARRELIRQVKRTTPQRGNRL